MNISKIILEIHDWGNDIKHAPHVEQGKWKKKQAQHQTLITSIMNERSTAPAPLPDDYILNINTLGGETLTIKMVRRGEEDEEI